MPTKKRYEIQKAMGKFAALDMPEYLKYQKQLSPNLNDLGEIVGLLQGGHWGTNNNGKGAAIANAGINADKHHEAVIKARKLLAPYCDRLGVRGITGIISRSTHTPESTVRRYIRLIQENPQDQ